MTERVSSDVDEVAGHPPLRQTALHALHVRLGAKMVGFAGYDMPVHYPGGVLKEHLHTRAAAGLFDVSHMGQIAVTSETPAQLARALETVLPLDILGLAPGRQRYGLLLDEAGGILDDLIVANLGTRYVIVVNAANKAADLAVLRARLPRDVTLALSPDALLALQGPGAESALSALAPEVEAMTFMDVRELLVRGVPCVISRSGYAGEDGFELSVPAGAATSIAEALLATHDVRPVGLGARDSLRLEAGLPLHGADIGPDTTPAEAALDWSISPKRRRDGERQGGFPGSDRVLADFARGTARRRVGLRPDGRAPVRAGAELFATPDAPKPIGVVTSGGFGPSIGAPVAMGYLPVGYEVGDAAFAEVRGQRLRVLVCHLPFIETRFKRRPTH